MDNLNPKKPQKIKENKDAIKDKKQLQDINFCLVDYMNYFSGIEIFLKQPSGLEKVRKLIVEGYKIPTVEEYINQYEAEKGVFLNKYQKTDPFFVKKFESLNILVKKVNSLGENTGDNIDKEELENIIKQAKEIIYKKS